MVQKTIKFMVTLIDDQSSGKLTTKSKVFIATIIFSFAVIFFGLAYGISYFSATSIKNVKKERDEILSEMIRINMGELPKSPSEVRFNLAKEFENVIDEPQKLDSLLKKYSSPNNDRINQISKKIKNNPTASIESFISEEKAVVTEEILILNKKIDSIIFTQNNIDENIKKLYSVNDKLPKVYQNQLFGQNASDLVVAYYNSIYNKNNPSTNLQKQSYTVANEKDSTKVEFYHKYIQEANQPVNTSNLFSNTLADNIINYNGSAESDPKRKSLFNFLKAELSIIYNNGYKKELDNKVTSAIELQKLYNQLEVKVKNNVSLDTYKKNKAYIFHNQYQISKLSIDYCIENAIKFYAFHKAIVYCLLLFTTIISLCVFVISKQGWSLTPKIIQIVAVCVLVIIGMLNLMSVVLKPKANYDTYISKAELNEKVQSDIVLFFNKYDNLKEPQIDSLILQNFSKITKFSEILPDTNEKGISKDAFGFSSILSEKTP